MATLASWFGNAAVGVTKAWGLSDGTAGDRPLPGVSWPLALKPVLAIGLNGDAGELVRECGGGRDEGLGIERRDGRRQAVARCELAVGVEAGVGNRAEWRRWRAGSGMRRWA